MNWLSKFKIKKYNCRMCKDTGSVVAKIQIPRSELSPIDRAELLVNGGYAYREVVTTCFCQEEAQ